jgi:hypothetical protein
MLNFSCRQDNDVYRAVLGPAAPCPRFDSLEQAVDGAAPGAAVLALADDYPARGVPVAQAALDQAARKHLRLYLEYPSSLPGYALGEPQPTQWERAVVSSDWFGAGLPRHTILALHGCWHVPVTAGGGQPAIDPSLVVARVAGYRTAVHGLPGDARPILFELPGFPALVATSKLSQFVRGRYGPRAAWQAVWESVLRWLARASEAEGAAPFRLAWSPSVGLQAGRDEPLPPEAEPRAFARSVQWFRGQVVFSVDWKKAACEGFESGIDCEGRQMRRVNTRGDCTAETAMVFAWDWAARGNPASRQLAGQILDTVWAAPDFRQADPASPAYGLSNWYERGPVFYGDDNARVILPTLAAAGLLNDSRWDDHVLRCLLANLRTTGRLGFRRNRIDLHEFHAHPGAWRFFQAEETVSLQPHYQAYLWAAFLWAHALTGYDGFLDRTRTAIRMTMEAYPAWKWTNGFTQELARMLLPLAFLARVEDTDEHRAWLGRIAGDLLENMQPSGAIRERLGPLETGDYAPPKSNAEYGTREASLIQQNGDPACDLLYTTNYAFLGLHEAAAATGDPALKQAEDRLADFLCRIQARSTAQPYLDGAWMRSFDDALWEYWGSSADLGWGAWSVESGWTNTWIASVLAMRATGASLFDLSTAGRLKARLPELVSEMLPKESI